MSGIILSRCYPELPVCNREILRYAGCKQPDEATSALLDSCLNEAKDKLTYKVCYRELPVSVNADICDFGSFRLQSKNLAAHLGDCNRVILFAATVGVGIDRLIAKYGRISPARALLFQAIGAERIEALCDAFCRDMVAETGMPLKPRFSPGYGDLPLTAQRDVFAVLDCSRQIGLTLNDSFLMSPSKSVTAFVGLSAEQKQNTHSQCSTCHQQDCAFRGAL